MPETPEQRDRRRLARADFFAAILTAREGGVSYQSMQDLLDDVEVFAVAEGRLPQSYGQLIDNRQT